MAVAWALVSLLALVAGLLAPGWLLARRLLRATGGVETAVFAVGFGLAVVPTVTFAVAWILGVPFSAGIVLAVSATVVLSCRPWSLPPLPRTDSPVREAVVLVVLLAGALALLQATDFHAVRPFRFMECCLHSVASYLWLGDPPSFAFFDPGSGADVHYVVSRPEGPVFGLGLWASEQRPLNGAIVAVAVLLAGRGGIEILAALVFFVVAGASALTAGTLLRSWTLRVAVGLAVPVGLHGLAGYMLNESTFALAFSALAFARLVPGNYDLRSGATAGVFLGAAFGSRFAALALLLPLAFSLCGTSPRDRRLGRSIAAIAGALAFALPWLVAYAILKGNPFFHTSQHLRIPHDVLGFQFDFRPLNWPFFESLVRSPADVLPPLLYVPVKLVLSAGAVLVAAGLLGLAALASRGEVRDRLVLVLTWAAPLALFLMLLADLDREKVSWLLPAMPAVALPLAAFASTVVESPRRTSWVGAWIVLSAGLAVLPAAIAGIDVPVDPRPLPFLPYYVADGDSFNPGSMDDARADLSRVAVLPSLQDVSTPGQALRSLASPRIRPAAPIERVFVRLDGRETGGATFPIATSASPPALPDTVPIEPASLLQFVNMQTMIVLTLPMSPVATVRVAAEPGRLHVNIDPGPLPHGTRHMAFMLDEQFSDDLDAGTGSGIAFIEVGGAAIPVRALGYRLRQGDRTREFVTLVTNLAVPAQPSPGGAFDCDGSTCRWEWGVIHDDAPGRADGAGVLDFVGPGYW